MSGGDFVLLALFLAIYFLPWIVAAQRKHRNRAAICALNFFLGWTVIGWVAALVWSLTADTIDAETVRKQAEKERKEGIIRSGGLLSKFKSPTTDADTKPEEAVFRPDGMAEGVPYRVLPNGEAEALVQGGIVRFWNLEQLQSALGTATPIETKTAPDSSEVRQIASNVNKLVLKPDAWQRPSPTENAPMTFEQKIGMWVFFGVLLIGLFLLFALDTH